MLLKNRHLCFWLILLCALPKVYAQTNLVNNGSFEANKLCPLKLTDTTTIGSYILEWKSPGLNSPKYFNSCAPTLSGLSIPQNYAGTQTAHSGSAYAGISVFRNPLDYDVSMGKQRQYLQTKLSQPLKSGRKYYFEMYLSKADSSTMGFAVNNLGAYFSQNETVQNDSFGLNVSPQIVTTSYLTDKINWVKVSATYTATGGELYLTIGRFGDDDITSVQNINGNLTHEAFYYVDDIALIDSCTTLDHAANQILGPDSAFCVYAPFTKNLMASTPQTAYYLWDNGSVFPNRVVSDTGKYWVRLTNGNCQASDTIQFKSNQKPGINLGKDTAICFNTPVLLQSSLHKPHYSYQWFIRSFGTNFLVSSSPTYSINSPDSIIVVVSDASCTNKDTILVRKSNLKRANLSSDTTICRQVKLSLNASSTGASNYVWNTGSSAASLTTKDLSQYWVMASDGLCFTSDTLNINYLGAKAPVRDTTICETSTLKLQADPTSNSYLWSSGEVTPFIYALFDGDYRVMQQKDGCTTLDTTTVTINKVPVISLGRDTNVCISPFHLLDATSPYGTHYLWNTGDTTSKLQVINTGYYLVNVSNKTCSYSDTVLVRVQINTPFSFGPDRYDCFETGIILSSSISRVDSFQWSTLSRDSFILIKQPGTYWLRTSSGYCTNYDTIELIQKPKPSLFIGNDTTVCRGQTLKVDAHSPGNAILWSTGDTTQTLTLKNENTYIAIATNSFGCHASDTFEYHYFPNTPIFDVKQYDICDGSSIILQPIAKLTSLHWVDGGNGPTFTSKETGWVWLRAIDSLGCEVSDSLFVTKHSLPGPQLDPELFTCELPVTLTPAQTFIAYLWQDTDTTETFEATSFGQYKLRVTDQFQCSSISFINVINNCPSEVTVPNVFTPDFDGKNDDIIPDYINIKETQWQILNRWGQVVFSTNRMDESWDGTIHSKEAEAGVYYFTLTCKGSRDETIERKGTITLIR